MIVRDIIEKSVWSPVAIGSPRNPLFTVLLSVTKRSTTEQLSNAINSVLAQEFSNIELIVIDDSQSPEIHSQVDRIGNQDDRVRYVRHPQSVGIKAIGLLEGMRAARGEYLLLLNSNGTLISNSLTELSETIGRKRFQVGCGKMRIVTRRNDGSRSERLLGNEQLSQVHLKSLDFLPETGIVLHKSVPQSVGFIDPHFVLSNCAVLDYWKRLSRSYEIARLNIIIGTETQEEATHDFEYGTQTDTVLYREWFKISRNSLLLDERIDCYNVRVKRRFSVIAELEHSYLEEIASQQWWFGDENCEVEEKEKSLAHNEKHGKIHLVGHDITASTTIPFGHFEDEFFHPIAYRHLTHEDLITSQAIILSRSLFDAEAQSLINSARAMEIPLYYYFDDNFEVLGRSFSAYAAYTSPRIREQLKDFKGILVPNSTLHDYCVDNLWHPNVMLFPPTVAPPRWCDNSPLPPKKPGTVRIVFLGGSHRSSDFNKFVLPAIVSVNEKLPVELIVIGDHGLKEKEIGGVKLHNFAYEVSYELTISRLIHSSIDILVHAGSISDNNPFKTPNALMNAWQLDAVAVVSNQAPYLHVNKLGIALMAKADSIQSWRDMILTVAEDTATVENINRNLDQHIKAEYAGVVNVGSIQSILACLCPLNYTMIRRRYRHSIESFTKQEGPISHRKTVPSSPIFEQPHGLDKYDDIPHKGFSRLYSEINYNVIPDQDNWSGIAFRIGTYSQQARGELRITIYEESDRQPLVTKSLDLMQITDNQRVNLDFEPIQRSANRPFRVSFSVGKTQELQRLAIYEEVERESAFRRILRRRGILKFGRKLACKLTYENRTQDSLVSLRTSECAST